jgi:hypothetical protein
MTKKHELLGLHDDSKIYDEPAFNPINKKKTYAHVMVKHFKAHSDLQPNQLVIDVSYQTSQRDNEQ